MSDKPIISEVVDEDAGGPRVNGHQEESRPETRPDGFDRETIRILNERGLNDAITYEQDQIARRRVGRVLFRAATPERIEDRLAPNHLAELRQSGLTDDTIRDCRFYTIPPEDVTEVLGWRTRHTKLGPALGIPYSDPWGLRTGFVRLKPDVPRSDGGKYESPVKSGNHAYLPPRTRSLLFDPTEPIIITEGEKKAAAVDQAGFACIGLAGIWSWTAERDKDPETGRKVGDYGLMTDLLSSTDAVL